METERLERVYISAKLEDTRRLCSLRNEVFDRSGVWTEYDKVNPHITVVPPFYFDKDRIDVVDELVSEVDITGKQVTFNNLSVWRNITEPNYIMLDVDTDIRDQQLELVDSIRANGGEDLKTPVPPHMTLLKKIERFTEPSDRVKRGIQACVGDYTDVKPTTIKEVEPVVG